MKGITRKSLVGFMSLCLVMAFTFSYFVPVSAHDANVGEKSKATEKAKPQKANGTFNPIKVTVRLEDVNKTMLEPVDVTIDKPFVEKGNGYWSDAEFDKPVAFLALQKAAEKLGLNTNDKEQFDCGEGGKGLISKLGSGWESEDFKLIVNNKTADDGIGKQVLNAGDEVLITSYDQFSDPIAFFEQKLYENVKTGDTVKFKLLYRDAFGGDDNPADDATLEIDGKPLTSYKTNSDGEVEYTFKEKGVYHISATGEINGSKFIRPYAKVIVKGADPKDDKFDVEFITGDGFPKVATEKIHKGEPVPKPKMDEQVTVKGQLYRFKGWYKDEQFKTKWDFAKDKITENTKIYAKYEKVPKRTVKFKLVENYDGVAVPNDVIVNDGDKVIHNDIKYPGKDVYYADKTVYPFGYAFDGFYADKECKTKWQLNTPITSDQTVYIKWIKDRYFPKYKVIAVPGGKELPDEMREILENKPSTSYSGYTRGETMVYWKDLSAYTYGDDSHTFTGKEEGVWKTKNLKLGKYVERLPETGEIKPEDVTITHEVEFVPVYWVDFDVDGASIKDNLKRQSRYYDKGDKVNRALTESEEDLPERKGYRFVGWYKDAKRTQRWDFENDTIQADTTLYAKMIQVNSDTPLYKVEFVLNGGKPTAQSKDKVKPLVLNEGQKIPNEPTYDDVKRPGYYFAGWYRDSEFKDKWNFYYDRVSADFGGKLYAKWARAVNYQPEFFNVEFKDPNGKEIATKQRIEIGDFLAKPKYDENKYTLKKGWYKDKEMTEKWDFKEDVVSKDMTLYGEVEDDPGTKPNPGEKPNPDPGTKPDPGEKPSVDKLQVVTDGNNSSVVATGNKVVYTKGVSDKAVYRIKGKNLTVDDLISIQVDGKYVSRENYVAETGSIVITFNKSYMDSLSVGRHEVKFNTTKGIAKAEIVVKEKSQTNSNSNMSNEKTAKTGDATDLMSIAGIFAIAAGAFMYLRKRNF